jgi:hypothetical protein
MTQQSKPIIKEHLQQVEDAINKVVPATPNTVPTVPSDWAALGATTGYSPKLAEALRLYIVGPYNEGKTTFDGSIPNNIILDFEDGANAVVGTNSIRIHIKDYTHLDKVIAKLIEDSKNGKRHWDRVSFDTIEEFVDLMKHQLEEEKNQEDIFDYGSQGHGYNLVLQRVWSKVMDLEQAGYTWAIVGHQKVVTTTNPVTKKDETKLREAVIPSIANKIKNKSDFQLTVYCLSRAVELKKKQKLPSGQVIEVPIGTEVRKTYYVDCLTTSRGEGKSRGVPDMETKFEVPLVGGWNVFREKYNAAVVAAKKKYQ